MAWEPSVDFTDEELQAEWAAFQEMRRQIHKPMSEIARGRAVMKLSQWDRATAIASLRQSIDNDWQGLFEPRQRRQRVPYNVRESRITQLNKRKAQLLRMPRTAGVERELASIEAQLHKL
jgi:hypothetical protein